MNCASVKYLSRPFRPAFPYTDLDIIDVSKILAAVGLTELMPLVRLLNMTLTRLLVVKYHSCTAHGKIRSEVALWQFPARPPVRRPRGGGCVLPMGVINFLGKLRSEYSASASDVA